MPARGVLSNVKACGPSKEIPFPDQPRPRQVPRYKVILHHDDANDLMFVVRSVMELTRNARRMGDGVFYLPVSMWPEGKTQLPLSETWTTMS